MNIKKLIHNPNFSIIYLLDRYVLFEISREYNDINKNIFVIIGTYLLVQ